MNTCAEHLESLVLALLEGFGTVQAVALDPAAKVPCDYGGEDGIPGCGDPSIAEVSR